MTTFTVTTASDLVGADGQRSLREAVNSANATPGADTILFAPALEGHTLTLTQGELQVLQDITIDGDADNGGSQVTLSGGDASRLLRIDGVGTDVVLQDLTLAHGHVDEASGGAIQLNAGTLALSECTVRDSDAYSAGFGGGHAGDGGGIFAAAGTVLQLTDSTISGNESRGVGGIYTSGGGIASLGDTVISHVFLSDNHAGDGGGMWWDGGFMTVEDSTVTGNTAGNVGGGLDVHGGSSAIARSLIADNTARYGGGIASSAPLTVTDGSLMHNVAVSGYGSGILASGDLVVRNSTITANGYMASLGGDPGAGGGISASARLDIANSIVAGNVLADLGGSAPDISGTITSSNGHSIFGSDVPGNVAGDREGIAASSLFISSAGVPVLRNETINPALSGGDRFTAMTTDELSHVRPLPGGSLPDIGATELSQALSTHASANNDVLTGTSAANTISGLDGADRINGAAGNDTLSGGNGSDLLEGGAGNDKLYGGSGVDTAYYGGSTAVLFDLSGSADTARRGADTDTLSSIQSAIGSSAADTFRGDGNANQFMGGDGKDTYTGGGGRDTFDFNALTDSRVGASARDVITDFVHDADRIDLTGIDADATKPGDQAFHWVGSAAFATGHPGEVGWFTSGGNTVIHASNDADSAGELQIQLTGSIGTSLAASDFYL